LTRSTHVLHDALRFFDLANELVFLSLDLSTSLLAQGRLIIRVEPTALDLALLGRLGGVECESGVLNIATGLGGELNVGVEGCLPASKETCLDLLVLSQSCFANLLFSQRILLQSLGEGLLRSG
jgi:hypothetical protein